MKTISLLTVVLAGLLAGCSSTPTQVDKGPIKAATFSFVASAQPDASFADKRADIHQMIQAAITKNLAAKGLSKVDTGGDVTVAYLVIVGNNATTESINTYFGYGRDSYELHSKAQSAYSKSNNPNYFEAGTLLVDIIDARTFKVLDRNHVTRPRLGEVANEVRAVHIQEAVDAVLSKVQIAK
jgi:hypothetical protein